MEANFEPQFRGGHRTIALDVGQRLIALNIRLTFAQQVEVGAVQHENGATHRLPPLGARCMMPPFISPVLTDRLERRRH
jgi:hypothetical protein